MASIAITEAQTVVWTNEIAETNRASNKGVRVHAALTGLLTSVSTSPISPASERPTSPGRPSP